MKYLQNPTNVLTLGVTIWVFITLILNFVVPHQWFFDYKSLVVDDEVCRDTKQQITGVRWALLRTPASGVDQIFLVGVNQASDRYEWGEGRYPQGLSTSSWSTTLNVPPGEYMWKATTLKLNVFYMFPVFLGDKERPVSNKFNVIVCEQ